MDFWALGQELFNDGDRFAGRFVQADILDAGTLGGLGGRFDVVVMSKVLHQFEPGGQVAAARNLVGLVRGRGAMVVGEQPGTGGAEAYGLLPPVAVGGEGKGKEGDDVKEEGAEMGGRRPGQWNQTVGSWRLGHFPGAD